MKKLFAFTGAILIACVIVSASISPRPLPADDPGGGADSAFVMREEDGRVVVYRGGALYLRTDTRVAQLPKSDRVKLAEGITVYSEKELKRLVEDYCS